MGTDGRTKTTCTKTMITTGHDCGSASWIKIEEQPGKRIDFSHESQGIRSPSDGKVTVGLIPIGREGHRRTREFL